jgi:hypothetical protein
MILANQESSAVHNEVSNGIPPDVATPDIKQRENCADRSSDQQMRPSPLADVSKGKNSAGNDSGNSETSGNLLQPLDSISSE